MIEAMSVLNEDTKHTKRDYSRLFVECRNYNCFFLSRLLFKISNNPTI